LSVWHLKVLRFGEHWILGRKQVDGASQVGMAASDEFGELAVEHVLRPRADDASDRVDRDDPKLDLAASRDDEDLRALELEEHLASVVVERRNDTLFRVLGTRCFGCHDHGYRSSGIITSRELKHRAKSRTWRIVRDFVDRLRDTPIAIGCQVTGHLRPSSALAPAFPYLRLTEQFRESGWVQRDDPEFHVESFR
jgi:hypothetical protein